MNVDGEAFVAALKTQRNDALDAAAMLKGALDGAQKRVAELEAEVEKLKPKGDG